MTAAKAVSLNCGADEDIFEILQLPIERVVLEHDVLKIAFSQFFSVAQLRVFLS